MLRDKIIVIILANTYTIEYSFIKKEFTKQYIKFGNQTTIPNETKINIKI